MEEFVAALHTENRFCEVCSSWEWKVSAMKKNINLVDKIGTGEKLNDQYNTLLYRTGWKISYASSDQEEK
jgi:hypothetical protein